MMSFAILQARKERLKDIERFSQGGLCGEVMQAWFTHSPFPGPGGCVCPLLVRAGLPSASLCRLARSTCIFPGHLVTAPGSSSLAGMSENFRYGSQPGALPPNPSGFFP